MNFILFGPPGVGKSTLIAILKSNGVRAIDLEDVYPSRVRFSLPNQLSDVILGGADLDPKRSYPNTKKILIIADQKTYDERRLKRDSHESGKSSQRQHKVLDWMTGVKWDHIIDTTNQSRYDTATLIRALFSRKEDKDG